MMILLCYIRSGCEEARFGRTGFPVAFNCNDNCSGGRLWTIR